MQKMDRFKRTLALLLAAGLIFALTAGLAEEEQDKVVYDPEEEVGFMDPEMDRALRESLERVREMRHILLLGIDARPGETTGRSDTMVIVTLDGDGDVIKLTSLMRDLYVEIPGRKNNRLNAAYVFGGPSLLMETIERNFGVHVENYVAVNFSMLAELIDQLGGLTLTVEEQYLPRLNAVIRQDNLVLGLPQETGQLEQAGTQLLTGRQAQAYARYRYGTKDGDFERTERQREVLTLIFKELSKKSFVELGALAASNLSKVTTNLTLEDVLALAPAVRAMKDAEIRQLRIPADGAYTSQTIAGMAVLVPDRTKNTRLIADFLTEGSNE